MNPIRLFARTLERFERRWTPEPNTNCHLWTDNSDKDGYGKFHFNGETQRAHRVSWQLFRGSIPHGLCVLHGCDTPACVNPEHLFLGTMTDNNRDREKKGRSRDQNGEKNFSAKLTADQVRQIRASNEPVEVVATKFGIASSHVSRIRLNRLWKTALLLFILADLAVAQTPVDPVVNGERVLLLKGRVAGDLKSWLVIECHNGGAQWKENGFDPIYTRIVSDYKPLFRKLSNGQWELMFTSEIATDIP